MHSNIKAVISDMDGVLWRGSQPLPGLVDFFTCLRQRGMDFRLATNNSSNTPGDYVRKLAGFGVHGIAESQIITSGTATASWMRERCPTGAKIHVLGGAGLKRIMRAAGFKLVDEDASAVVCGIDFDLTYDKVKRASLLIRDGARFIGTNPDPSFPSPEGLVPGAGSILALLASASGVQPIIIGKPERGMFDVALEQLGMSPARHPHDRRSHRHGHSRRGGSGHSDRAGDDRRGDCGEPGAERDSARSCLRGPAGIDCGISTPRVNGALIRRILHGNRYFVRRRPLRSDSSWCSQLSLQPAISHVHASIVSLYEPEELPNGLATIKKLVPA